MSPERTRGVVELDAIRLHYVEARVGFVDAATIASMTDGGKSPGS